MDSLMPIGLIVTFTDQLDIVRHMPYDYVPVIAYGDGFVNSALNAVKARTQDEIILCIKDYVCRKFGIEKKSSFLGEGAFFLPGVFLSSFQLIVYGSRFDLTDNESYIIRCLILSGDCYRSTKQLAEYCSLLHQTENGIRVHVCGINKKAELRLPHPLIESRRGHGYRFGYFDDHTPK